MCFKNKLKIDVKGEDRAIDLVTGPSGFVSRQCRELRSSIYNVQAASLFRASGLKATTKGNFSLGIQLISCYIDSMVRIAIIYANDSLRQANQSLCETGLQFN